MISYKSSIKDGELIIKSKLGSGEKINPREWELLSGGSIRGLMKVRRGSFGKLIFSSPEAEPLKRYLMKGITKEEFASVIAQFVRVLTEIDRYALQTRNLEMYAEGVYITPRTRELIFIYRPVLDKEVGSDLNGFIRSLIDFATFSTLQDRAYVAELESILRDIEKYPPKTMSDYVCRLDKATYDRELSRSMGSRSRGDTQDPWGDDDETWVEPQEEDYGSSDGYGSQSSYDYEEETTFGKYEPQEETYVDSSNMYWKKLDESEQQNFDEPLTGVWEEQEEPTSVDVDIKHHSEPEAQTSVSDEVPVDVTYEEAIGKTYKDVPMPPTVSDGAYKASADSAEYDEPMTEVEDYPNEPPEYDEPPTMVEDYPDEPYIPEKKQAPAYENEYDEPPTTMEDIEPVPRRRPPERRGGSAPRVFATIERCSTGEVYAIKQDEILIGKDRLGADIYIDGNPAVSRRHALISQRAGRFFITDMRSLNHTFVNGRELRAEQEFEIRDGSRLCLADENFIFRTR